SVLLTPLPVRDPSTLLLLGDARGDGVGTAPIGSFFAYSVDLYRHLQAVPVFEGLAAVQSGDETRVSARGAGWSAPQPARAKLVSGNYFDVLGVHAIAGRAIVPTDDWAAAPPVAMISYPYWQQSFKGNPAVIGSGFDISGVALTIV